MFAFTQLVNAEQTTVLVGYGTRLFVTSVTDIGGRREKAYYTNTGLVTQDLGKAQDQVQFRGLFPVWSNLRLSRVPVPVNVQGVQRFTDRQILRRERLDEEFDKLRSMRDNPEPVAIEEKVGEVFVPYDSRHRFWRITQIQRERNEYALGKFNFLRWSMTVKAIED